MYLTFRLCLAVVGLGMKPSFPTFLVSVSSTLTRTIYAAFSQVSTCHCARGRAPSFGTGEG